MQKKQQKATEEIYSCVNGIQNTTHNAGESIFEIRNITESLQEVAETMHGSILNQSQATQEIVKAINKTATSSQTINNNIDEVAQTAAMTGHSASSILANTVAFENFSNHLRKQVQSIVEILKAA